MRVNFFQQIEWIDPTIAKLYLTKNNNNRPKKDHLVELYARLMKEGLWTISNDAITFNVKGELTNGQHRLFAVIKSGTTQIFNVMRNLPEESTLNMDNGSSRTAGDVMKLNGVSDAVKVAAVIRRGLSLANKATIDSNMGGGYKQRYSNSEYLTEYEKDPETWDCINKMSGRLYDAGRFMSPGEYGGYVAYLHKWKGHPLDKVENFFKEVAGVSGTTNQVTALLRTALTTDKISRYRMSGTKRQKLIIKAWNHWLTGKVVQKLSWSPSTEPDLWFL